MTVKKKNKKKKLSGIISAGSEWSKIARPQSTACTGLGAINLCLVRPQQGLSPAPQSPAQPWALPSWAQVGPMSQPGLGLSPIPWNDWSCSWGCLGALHLPG